MTHERVTKLEDGRWMIRAHAKLNLGLRVFPARADGFHDIESWMVPISWHDTLWVDVSEGVKDLSLEITGRAEGVPVEIEKNLVGRAAVKLAAAAGLAGARVGNAKIVLHKVLPAGGGIGGGSSDAANVLVALNEAWGLGWEEARLEGIAAELGSDVAFFVRGRASLCTGRGEIMTALPGRQALFAVLILPPFGCPTKEVYQAFDAGHQHGAGIVRADWRRMAQGTAEELNGMLVNDLEPAAFFVAPRLGELRRRAAELAGQPVHLTGSGSTLFTLCGSSVAAAEMEGKLAAGLGEAAVCVTVKLG